MNEHNIFTILLITGVIFLVTLLLVAAVKRKGTDKEPAVKGDRNISQIATGYFKSEGGGSYRYFIVRDEDTHVDYLVTIEAGTVKLEPKVSEANPQ